MPGKRLKTRIQNKIDTLVNFQEKNPYILSGELATAYQTVPVQVDGGDVIVKRVAYLYVGPGYFNDLVPIVGPSSDVKAWAKVDNFVDIVIANFVADDKSGTIAENDTVNDMINRINNNFSALQGEINKMPTKTSQLINDGEGEGAEIKDFLTGYIGYEYVTRDSIKNYLDNFAFQDIEEIRQKVEDLERALNEAIEQINGKFEDYYTKEEIDSLVSKYIQTIQLGNVDGGIILSASSTYASSDSLWNQIKNASRSDIEQIADAAASTALSQAKEYTDNKLGDFITISYQGPYDSYADLLLAHPTGKAGIIYLVSHNHNDNDSNDPTDSDIFDEYIWVESDGVLGSYEKVGNTDVKLSSYLKAVLIEDKTGVLKGDEGSVSKVEIVEDPVGSGNQVFKVTYKTLIRAEDFTPGYVAVGFGNGALKSTALVDLPLTGIAINSTSSINQNTSLGQAIRTLEDGITQAQQSGVKSVDIGTNGGLEVSGGPITSAGTLMVSHSARSTESSAIASTVGSDQNRTYINAISLDKYGHIVSVQTGQESFEDNYANAATFSTAKTSINLNISGVGENFKPFSASIPAIPSLMLTQTDDEDDYLVFYCGDSSILVSNP